MDILQQFLFSASGLVIGWALVMAFRKGGNDDDFGGMAWREYLMFKTFWLSNILKNESEAPVKGFYLFR